MSSPLCWLGDHTLMTESLHDKHGGGHGDSNRWGFYQGWRMEWKHYGDRRTLFLFYLETTLQNNFALRTASRSFWWQCLVTGWMVSLSQPLVPALLDFSQRSRWAPNCTTRHFLHSVALMQFTIHRCTLYFVHANHIITPNVPDYLSRMLKTLPSRTVRSGV